MKSNAIFISTLSWMFIILSTLLIVISILEALNIVAIMNHKQDFFGGIFFILWGFVFLLSYFYPAGGA